MKDQQQAGAKTRRCDDAFKREAVRLWKSRGRSTETTTRELGRDHRTTGYPLQTVVERYARIKAMSTNTRSSACARCQPVFRSGYYSVAKRP